jgi:NAD(P)-dependent dehydrogenase (short-subunit alcohol dehydrogenase family)
MPAVSSRASPFSMFRGFRRDNEDQYLRAVLDRQSRTAAGSAIIGTTSEQAYDPSPELYDYAQTKAATMNYVKSLAKQLDPEGIQVKGVAQPMLRSRLSSRRIPIVRRRKLPRGANGWRRRTYSECDVVADLAIGAAMERLLRRSIGYGRDVNAM